MAYTYTMNDEELRIEREEEERRLQLERDRLHDEEIRAQREEDRREYEREVEIARQEREEEEFRERLAALDRELHQEQQAPTVTPTINSYMQTLNEVRRSMEAHTGFATHAARERAILPPLDSVLVKVPGSEKLPSFGSLMRGVKTKEEIDNEAIKAAAAKQALLEATIADSKKKKKVRVLQPKRVKQADTSEYFRLHHAGRPLFYRYIRLPDENTREGKTVFASPFGGAAVLIVLTAANQISFSFSICKDDEIFIKDEARSRCQTRYKNGVIVVVKDMNVEASMFDNIVLAYENHVFNANREPSEPKMIVNTYVTPIMLKKLYKMMKHHVQTGGAIA